MKTYPITIQPNPRSPVHYRGEVMLKSWQLNSDWTLNYHAIGVGRLARHRWSWSPWFWLKIAWAWIGPKPEIDV